jgi:alkylation response protein AidB-like acyl-CoA dehydrogenase
VKGRAIDRIFRQSRGPRIYEGTSEIQRVVIGRDIGRDRA